MRIVAYARVSSLGQAEKGLSIPHQFDKIREYCESRSYEVVEQYADEGVTGLTMERPQWRAMRRAGREGRFDGVAIYDVSRIGRNSMANVEKEELRNDGLRVIFVADNLGDTEDPFRDEATEEMLALQAKAQSRKLQREGPERMRVALLRGGRGVGGSAPFGYTEAFPHSEGGRPEAVLIPDPTKAALVLQAFQLYANGASTRDVCSLLAPHGGPSRPTNAGRFLRNPKYKGARAIGLTQRRIRGGKVKTKYMPRESWAVREDAHEAIVPPELFDRVQALLDVRGARKERTRSSAMTNPFPQGFVRCANCGSVAEWHKSEKAPYPTTWTFMCRNRREKAKHVRNDRCKGSVRVEKVAAMALNRVGWLLQGDHLKQSLMSAPIEPNPELSRAKAEYAKLLRKRDNLGEAIEERGPTAYLLSRLADVEEALPPAKKLMDNLRAIEPARPDYSQLVTDARFVRRMLELGLQRSDTFHEVRAIIGRVIGGVSIDFSAASEKRELARRIASKGATLEEKVKAADRLATLHAQGEHIAFRFSWDHREKLLAIAQASARVLESRYAPSTVAQAPGSSGLSVNTIPDA